MAYSDIAGITRALNAITCLEITDNTPRVSSIIDMLGFGSLMFVTNIGVLTDGDATFTALVEDEDDFGFSNPVTVPDELLINAGNGNFQFNSDNGVEAVRRIGYIGKKQFVRYTITPANNTASASFSVVAILGSPIKAATIVNAS